MKKEHAEDIRCWKSGSSSPDSWIDKAAALIRKHGGEVLSQAWGHDAINHRSAFQLEFKIEQDVYKIIWPVMPTKHGEINAAKRQAATLLFHDVESKIVTAQVFGARTAFFSWLLLPNGQTAAQISGQDLIERVPQLLLEN